MGIERINPEWPYLKSGNGDFDSIEKWNHSQWYDEQRLCWPFNAFKYTSHIVTPFAHPTPKCKSIEKKKYMYTSNNNDNGNEKRKKEKIFNMPSFGPLN